MVWTFQDVKVEIGYYSISMCRCLHSINKRIVKCFCGKYWPLGTNINATMTDTNDRYSMRSCVPYISIILYHESCTPGFVLSSLQLEKGPMLSNVKVHYSCQSAKTFKSKLKHVAQLFSRTFGAQSTSLNVLSYFTLVERGQGGFTSKLHYQNHYK